MIYRTHLPEKKGVHLVLSSQKDWFLAAPGCCSARLSSQVPWGLARVVVLAYDHHKSLPCVDFFQAPCGFWFVKVMVSNLKHDVYTVFSILFTDGNLKKNLWCFTDFCQKKWPKSNHGPLISDNLIYKSPKTKNQSLHLPGVVFCRLKPVEAWRPETYGTPEMKRKISIWTKASWLRWFDSCFPSGASYINPWASQISAEEMCFFFWLRLFGGIEVRRWFLPFGMCIFFGVAIEGIVFVNNFAHCPVEVIHLREQVSSQENADSPGRPGGDSCSWNRFPSLHLVSFS